MFKRPSCGSASECIPRSKRLQLMLEAQKLGIVLSESALDAAIRSTISSTSSTTIGQDNSELYFSFQVPISCMCVLIRLVAFFIV